MATVNIRQKITTDTTTVQVIGDNGVSLAAEEYGDRRCYVAARSKLGGAGMIVNFSELKEFALGLLQMAEERGA